ncbi:hypothetical protein H5410_061094 [Solanum commersonii]|uniref:Uncharacterized protein n=1 Tax=Solanum commersonii TaxID=4109 RepID=A0A9J5W843_SOLCO|nr:hypothetical protein H5410_061094 [Solanum commersonii]
MVDAAIRDGVNIGFGAGVDVGGGICAGAGVGGCIGIGAGVGVTSCSRKFGFLCEKCKKYDDNSIMYLQTLSGAMNGFKYKGEGVGSGSFHQARGIRQCPVGMDWIDAKKVIAVMNMNNNHFVTLEILLNEGRKNVYDCNIMVYENDKFLTFIQSVFKLLPSLLR